MTDDAKTYPTCPECGSGEFIIHGLVAYRQVYIAPLDEYGKSAVDWDTFYPSAARCRLCDSDATELFRRYDHVPFLVSVPPLE